MNKIQEEKARADALIAKGRRLQKEGDYMDGRKAQQIEQAQAAQHAAWVRRQNLIRSAEWRAAELEKLRQAEREKEKMREQWLAEERKVAEYREKLRKGRQE